MPEGGCEGGFIAHHDDAARLGHEQPLVGVDRDRVGPLQAYETLGDHRCCGQTVGTIDMHPDAMFRADVGDRIQGIDGAGERGARRGDDRDGDAARCKVGADQPIECLRSHATVVIDRHGTQVVGADAEQLDRAHDGVVRVG